jgi:hypothetical protein
VPQFDKWLFCFHDWSRLRRGGFILRYMLDWNSSSCEVRDELEKPRRRLSL